MDSRIRRQILNELAVVFYSSGENDAVHDKTMQNVQAHRTAQDAVKTECTSSTKRLSKMRKKED